jgi:BirA family biotin operon repressor/biotin-[acetyl-CoA-carboxylase] ligase
MSHSLIGQDIKAWRYLESTGSTNADALAWAVDGAPDMALISAEHQSEGRGRDDRKWVTNPGSGLAFSLIVRPTKKEYKYINRFTALAAIALGRVLKRYYGITAQVKWPNDVLIHGKKVAGILVEVNWEGEKPTAVVIGVGVNVTSASLPPEEGLNFPATCIEAEVDDQVDRTLLLRSLIKEIARLRRHMTSPGLIKTWNRFLAFKNTKVRLHHLSGSVEQVTIQGVSDDGSMQIKDSNDEIRLINAGELEISYNQNVQ